MTIDLTDNAPRVSYSVSQGATTTSFAVPFEFFDTTDLKVVVDGTTKTITTHYTVSGGNGSTGTVTMSVTGATGGSTVIIYREIPLSRTTDFPTSGAFPIDTLNTELDRTVALFDDRKDRIDRSIRLLDTDDAATMTLPTKDNRKGTVLGFNATTGAVEAGPTIANVSSLSSITSNIDTLGSIASDVTTVAGISSDVTTVANISSNVTTVAGIQANITTVAGKASLITSQFASDMNLVTADFVSDVNTVANSDIINDFNTLATSDIVADMNLLATSSNITAMANLGVSSVITNMSNLNASGVISNIGTVAGSIPNINTVAAADSNITALNASGVIANIATVAGANSNISTVATNINSVNSFADRYRVASSAPTSSLDAGDLYFDTSTNKLNVYSGSSWATTGEAAQRSVTTHNVTSAGTQTISASYTVGLVDIYLNGLKLNISEGDATASNGTSVVVTGASIGDIIEVVALSPFNTANYGTAASKNVGTTNDTVPVFTSSGLDIAARDLITTGKILYANMYSTEGDLPSASTYHGMFAHVHGTGKAYYSHAGNWIPLANESDAYVHPNHSGEVTSTADGATEIADNVVDEANLKVSNAPINGYYLQAQSGNTGGLTWAAVAAGGAIGLSDSVNVLDVKRWSLPWGYAINGQNSQNFDSAVTRPSTGVYQESTTGTTSISNQFMRAQFYNAGFQGNAVLRTASSGEGWKGEQFCSFNPYIRIRTARQGNQTNLGPAFTEEPAFSFMPFQVNSSTGVITIGQSGKPTIMQPKNGMSVGANFSAAYTSCIGSYGSNNYVFASTSQWWNQGSNMHGYGHFYLNTDNTVTNLDRSADYMDWDSSFYDNTGRSWFANFRTSVSQNKNVYDVGVRPIEYQLTQYGLPIDSTENKTKIVLIGASSHQSQGYPNYSTPIAHTMEFSTTKTTSPTWEALQVVGNTNYNFASHEAMWRQQDANDEIFPCQMIQQYGFYVDGNSSNTTGYNLPTSMFVTFGTPYVNGASQGNVHQQDYYMYWWGHRADGKMVSYQLNGGFNSSITDATTGVIPDMYGYSLTAFKGQGARRIPRCFHLVGQDASNPDPCVMVYNQHGSACMKVVANSGWSSNSGSATINANGGGRPLIFKPQNPIPCDNRQYYRSAPEFHSIPGERDTFMCIGETGYDGGKSRAINKFRIDSTNGEITYLGSVDLRYLLEAYTPSSFRSGGGPNVGMHPIWDSSSSTWGKILLVLTGADEEIFITIDMPTFQT